ncbi:MAG TPA: Hsp20/alpha crystallin family protein [Desulfomicrobiaceae bacterium]|nr:Hsp20/alpha crystallin family protein [Desulfomicrobiaceae bacterium]
MNKDVVKKENRNLPRVRPYTDILEKEDGFHIFMDLPGVEREDLVIDLNDSELEIRAKSIIPKNEARKAIHLEFGDGEYVRAFTISDTVDREKIKATLKSGILELFLPKAEKAMPRKIEITGA